MMKERDIYSQLGSSRTMVRLVSRKRASSTRAPFLRFKIIYLNSFFIIGDILRVSVLISHISHRNRHSIIIGLLLLLLHAHQRSHHHHPLLLNTRDRQAGQNFHRGIGPRIQSSQGPATQSPKIDSIMLPSCLPAAYPVTIREQLACIQFFSPINKQK